MRTFRQKLSLSFTRFMTMQLFLTLASLPIMAAWGLPISLMSPIGNFLFHPLLTLFLLISSFIFFCELFYIPNGIFITALEYLTAGWQKALHCTYGSVLVGCKKPSPWLLAVMAIIIFASLRHKFMAHPIRRMAGFVIMFFAFWALLQFDMNTTPSPAISTIPCNRGNITIIQQGSTTTVIDPGYLGRRISAPTWVTFTLVPEIIKKTGSLTIDHLIIQQPGIVLFDALYTLCSKMQVKHIYMPSMKGDIDLPLRRTFNRFYAQAKQQNIAITSFYSKPITLTLADKTTLCITPDKPHSYRTITYRASRITGIIDNKPLTIYDSKSTGNDTSSKIPK